jgi:flagellar protein FliJ
MPWALSKRLPGIAEMKRFRFNLATLLRHRVSLEEKERVELSNVRYRHQTQQNHHKSLQSKLRETLVELTEKRTASTDHQELTWYYLYIDRLHLEIKQSGRKLAQLEQELEKQRTRVIEATKNRKVLDTLKVKKEKEHNLTMDRMEQKAIDDLVVIRYANKER